MASHPTTPSQKETAKEEKKAQVEETEAEKAAQKEKENQEKLLSLSGAEREEERAKQQKEAKDAGENLTPEEQRIEEDEETAAPVGHIPAG
jgi:hypothetical protein